MDSLPCVITFPLNEALEILQKETTYDIQLVDTSPSKLDLLGEEKRVLAQNVSDGQYITLIIAYEQISS